MSSRSGRFSVIAIAFAGRLIAADAETERLKAEAIGQWHRLETAGACLQGSFTLTEHIPGKPERLEKDGSVTIRRPSVWVNLRQRVLEQSRPGVDNGSVRDMVFGKCPTYVFRLQRHPTTQSYFVQFFGEPAQADDELIEDFTRIYGEVPWTLGTKRLSEIETDPNFKLVSLRRETTGEKLVRMEATLFQTKVTPTAMKETWAIKVQLDPARSWAVRSYECKIDRTFAGGSNSIINKVVVDYRNDAGDFPPVPRRQTMVICNPDGSERVTMRTDYTEWKYRKQIDDNEVGLSAFGLPEPGMPAQRKSRVPNYVWLFAAACGCASVAALVRYLGRKKQSLAVGE